MRGIIVTFIFLVSSISFAESPCKKLVNEGLENFVSAEYHLVFAAKNYRRIMGPAPIHEKKTKCELITELGRVFDASSVLFLEAEATFDFALNICDTGGVKEAMTWSEHTVTSHNIVRRYQGLVAEYIDYNCK